MPSKDRSTTQRSQDKSTRKSKLTPGRVSTSASAQTDLILVADFAEDAMRQCGRGQALSAFETLEELLDWTRERLAHESDEVSLIRDEVPEWLVNQRLHARRQELLPTWLPGGFFREKDGAFIYPTMEDPTEPEIIVRPNDDFESRVQPVSGCGLVQLYGYAFGIGPAAARVHLADTVGLGREMDDG